MNHVDRRRFYVAKFSDIKDHKNFHSTKADLAQMGERQTEVNYGQLKSGGPVFDPQNSHLTFIFSFSYSL